MGTTNEQLIKSIIDNWAQAVRAKIFREYLLIILPIFYCLMCPNLFSQRYRYLRLSWEQVFYNWYGDDGQFEVIELNITAGNDVAFCHGIINCSGVEKGQKVSIKVRLTIGLKKISNQWLITHEHHSEAAG